jgi:hypothetical protein
MQTALFLLGLFPPPATGANIFTDRNRAGARSTTYARVKLVVQSVVRHVVGT